jgi:transposase
MSATPSPLRYVVGLDVAKADVQACLSRLDDQQRVTVKATRKFNNDANGHQALREWVGQHTKANPRPVSYVMEASGVYHEALAWYLHGDGQPLSILLPRRAKQFFQSLGHKSKTDPLDAKALAHMGCVLALPAWNPPSPTLAQLRKRTRQYEALQHTRTRIANQLHAQQHTHQPDKLLVTQLKALLRLIDKQLLQMTKAIEVLVKADGTLAAKFAHLTSIKGVGLLTAAVLVAETDGFALMENHRQLTSYAGYDVVETQSGQHRGRTRISKQGNSRLRRAMFMPAFCVVSQNVGAFVGLYERVLARNGCKMKAYVAVQRKLLTVLMALWKTNAPFDEHYQNKVAPTSGATQDEAAQDVLLLLEA